MEGTCACAQASRERCQSQILGTPPLALVGPTTHGSSLKETTCLAAFSGIRSPKAVCKQHLGQNVLPQRPS